MADTSNGQIPFAEKIELLSYLQKSEVEPPGAFFKIPRKAENQPAPLSFAQERLWFLDQLDPGNPVYNLLRVERLTGKLDVPALRSSLLSVIGRHEALRTSFRVENGLPSQFVASPGDLSSCLLDFNQIETNPIIREIDLASLPEGRRMDEALRIASGEALKPFDLSRGPLFRLILIRLGERDHFLVFVVHQIIFDWRSHGLFFHELATFYRSARLDQATALPRLEIQYSDYAAWQRSLMGSDRLNVQLTFWKRRLSGVSSDSALPADRPRPRTRTFRGARKPIVLSKRLSQALAELGRQTRASQFMTLIAAFAVLLYRYTGKEDLVVGFPMNRRDMTELEPLIGCFVNTLVLRTEVHAADSFAAILSRVREAALSAYAHCDLPFEALVDELHPARDLSQNPLFQVMFIFQDTPYVPLELTGVESEPVELDPGTAKFDLTLSMANRRGQIVGFFEYSTELFEKSTIEEMSRSFEILLEGIVAEPNQPIAALSILSEAERHRILIEWNDTAANYPKDKCIHELFEEQVERTPDAIALEFEETRITYRDLNRRTNQLAHYLVSLGVGQEKRVGICVERSIEMVVGLLGILKAGGAYVPLEPAYPRERLRFMLQDAQVSVLLTQETLVEDREWRIEDGDPQSSILDLRLKSVYLDRDWPVIAQASEEDPNAEVHSNCVAYVIYTSGSTGQPKGVQIEHRSVVNCLSSIGRQIDLLPQDAWLALTTISFDIAALELYLPLISGAKIVLANHEESADGAPLMARLKASGATVMQATPSMWKFLVDTGWGRRDDFKILCGGEALSRQLADRLLDWGGSVWNLYGPTEATIWSTMAKLTPDEKPVSIGQPIANTQIYILGSHLQPAPVGVAGELYIGGTGVARGYLNRPELTAETFVPNPFSNDPHSRLFRTGDRAKYRADGSIEFVGRVDNQVKIRGHRIELGEIETILRQHPSVKESVVVARECDSLGEKELVGYVVSQRETAASLSELRAFLREKLPDAMIPSLFVFVDALPLTPNGKIDRKALPPPDNQRPVLDQGFVEPRTEVEELVAQIWREVLKRDPIGIHDNFFDLGGHSLLATRVVARLRTDFNVDLPLRKLFELPTVGALAEHIDFLRRTRSGVSVPPIVPVPRERAIPLSFSQRRLWFLHKFDPNLTAYNIPATFRVEGDLNFSALEKALSEMINRHEILRTRIIEIDGQPVQQVIPPSMVTLPVIDLSHLSDDQAAAQVCQLAADDAHQPYSFQDAPLMRAKLLRLSEQKHTLILNFHHIVCDGSSLITFYQELAAFYEAFLDGKISTLPSLPVQYGDYAVWQQERLQGEVLEKQLAYWKQQLGRGLTPLNLPKDYERPVVPAHRGARLTQPLSKELTRGLESTSRREGVTLFMILLAAFKILLSRYTGQEDIVIGCTIAGRGRPEIDGLIGFFINALALRTDLSGNPNFLELLKRVREVCLDAYTHQDLPFEKIVEEINPQRDPGRNPIFQVMFNMADTSERVLNLAGCEVVKLSQAEPDAKFDIVLHAPEKDRAIELAIVYDADLFSESRIATMLDQYVHLLAQITERSQTRIGEYSLVSPSTRSRLPDPTQWLDSRWQGAIHELFSERARHTPDNAALIDPDDTWTYGELVQRSGQLASYLAANGIQPKDIVAIYAHRSSPLVLALLGVLKAGAVFVILDPAYPPARLLAYLSIARPKGWIQMAAAGELPDELAKGLQRFNLSCRLTLPKGRQALADFFRDQAGTETDFAIRPNDPAYIAFTSGSTGEPKGVLNRHGPITHFLPWQNDAFDLRVNDRFALLSGLAYNHLHRDVFTPLALGASLYVPPAETAREPKDLCAWLRANAVTVLHLTPALGQLLLSAGDEALPSLRRIFFGGDVLTCGQVARIRKLAPNAKIVSFYGATETQRAVGYYETTGDFAPADAQVNRPIPLGRGIQDVQLLLLNQNGQLAGVGELAELYVRSPHLGAGYVDDDARTREVFLKNPFTSDPEDRLYRTGELGRYLPDGDVEWAGRNDRRIKIRGHRVEIEEIEFVLKQHPAVKDAAVVLQDYEISSCGNWQTQEPKLDQRLVVYIAAEEAHQSLADLLHGYLSTRLPEYMVPADFIFLETLPLNPNGKVDYRALPSTQPLRADSPILSSPPSNAVEAKLCDIFAQVLDRERVGIDENFFRIGGHSLLAAQAAARIRETFGTNFELLRFFEAPTVAGLAKEIEVRLKGVITAPIRDNSDREEIEI